MGTSNSSMRNKQNATATRSMISCENMKRSPFLRLPPEIRDKIYRLSLTTQDGSPIFTGTPKGTITVNLIYVCRQIYNESAHIIFTENKFSLAQSTLACSELEDLDQHKDISRALLRVKRWEFALICTVEPEDSFWPRGILKYPETQPSEENFEVIEHVIDWVTSKRPEVDIRFRILAERRLPTINEYYSAGHAGCAIAKLKTRWEHLSNVKVDFEAASPEDTEITNFHAEYICSLLRKGVRKSIPNLVLSLTHRYSIFQKHSLTISTSGCMNRRIRGSKV